MAEKKNNTGGSFARDEDEYRRHQLDAIQKIMDDLCEIFDDPQQNEEALREAEAAIEAYAEYASAIIAGDQSMFDLKYENSSETGVDSSLDESTVAAESCDLETFANSSLEEPTVGAESCDLKTFANLFEQLLDKLHKMAPLIDKRTTLIKSKSDSVAKEWAFKNTTDEKKSEEDLVEGAAELSRKIKYLILQQNSRYLQSLNKK